MTLRILTFTLALVFTVTQLDAGTMFGIVKNEDGDPVSGAEVAVWGKEGLEASTDAEGKFRIKDDELIDGNRYSVTVSAEGYDQGQTMSVEIFDNVDEMEPIEIELYATEPMPEPEPLPEAQLAAEGQTGDLAAAIAAGEAAADAAAQSGPPPADESLLIPNLDEEAEGEDEPASDAQDTLSAPAME